MKGWYGMLLRFDGLCPVQELSIHPAADPCTDQHRRTWERDKPILNHTSVPNLCIMRFILHLHVLYTSPNLSNWILTTMFTQGFCMLLLPWVPFCQHSFLQTLLRLWCKACCATHFLEDLAIHNIIIPYSAINAITYQLNFHLCIITVCYYLCMIVWLYSEY